MVKITGQKDVMSVIDIMINSAQERSDILGHILLDGPPGTGKTSISNYVANKISANIKTVLGGNVTSLKQILPTLLGLQRGDVLFIDEIHRLNKRVSECLYTVLEDFKLHIPIDGEVTTFDIPKFTCIAATTKSGALETPLLNRFTTLQCTLYSNDELVEIIKDVVYSDPNKINFTVGAANIIANASRGTPRIAKSLTSWAKDVAISKKRSIVDSETVLLALEMRQIGTDGMVAEDRVYLSFLQRQKMPVGVNTIAASTNLDIDTITNVIEPFLLRTNRIIKTAKGRIANV